MSDKVFKDYGSSVEVTQLMYDLAPGYEQEVVLHHLLRAIDFNESDYSKSILGRMGVDDYTGPTALEAIRGLVGLNA